MRHSNFYYNDIYLGTLYESGVFDYMVFSSHAKYMDVERVVHALETIRKVGLSDDFNYDSYLESWKNFQFSDDGFEFR